MERIGMLKLDLYIPAATFLFPFGWSVSGFKPNIVLACFCWVVTLGLLIHAFCIYEGAARLSTTAKVCISVVVTVVAVVIAWEPVSEEYRREHFIIDAGKFVSVLRSQFFPRTRIRIGCSAYLEESCVYAGHFPDFFRAAGWRVEENRVQRTVPGKPEAGILLFLHGTGENNPDDPQSGLWTQDTESVRTVEKAFRAIGIRQVGRRADKTIPEDLIGIHFGYNAIAP
jgi:hypothetical protein